jgi:hypothetical protein
VFGNRSRFHSFGSGEEQLAHLVEEIAGCHLGTVVWASAIRDEVLEEVLSWFCVRRFEFLLSSADDGVDGLVALSANDLQE